MEHRVTQGLKQNGKAVKKTRKMEEFQHGSSGYFLKQWDIKFEDLIGENFSKLKKERNIRSQIQSVLARNE